MQAPAFKGAAHLYRLRGSPALPSDMPAIQQFAARGSHLVLYALVIAMPLIGWAMLSAGGYPITLLDAWHSPAILPQNVDLFALARVSIVRDDSRGYRSWPLSWTDSPRRRILQHGSRATLDIMCTMPATSGDATETPKRDTACSNNANGSMSRRRGHSMAICFE